MAMRIIDPRGKDVTSKGDNENFFLFIAFILFVIILASFGG